MWPPLPAADDTAPVADHGAEVTDGLTASAAWAVAPAGHPLVFPRRRSHPEPVVVADEPPIASADEWTWQVMPQGLLYRSYLAGAKEPRIWVYGNSDDDSNRFWDGTLGGRLGVLRYGTDDPWHPEGWQVDVEGAVFSRLDRRRPSTALVGADYRFGFPVTWAEGPWQFKTGYYHLCSHLGDEFPLQYPGTPRRNYTRDVCWCWAWATSGPSVCGCTARRGIR